MHKEENLIGRIEENFRLFGVNFKRTILKNENKVSSRLVTIDDGLKMIYNGQEMMLKFMEESQSNFNEKMEYVPRRIGFNFDGWQKMIDNFEMKGRNHHTITMSRFDNTYKLIYDIDQCIYQRGLETKGIINMKYEDINQNSDKIEKGIESLRLKGETFAGRK
jgi:hypothetical protein